MANIVFDLALRAFRRLTPMPAASIEGYEHEDLVETVYRKTVAYKADGPSLELFGARKVLDFGGGCGAHYKEAKSETVRWAVVETQAMVSRAVDLQTDSLRFFTDVKAAATWLGSVELMHSSGAVQFTPDPIATVRQLCGLGAHTMMWRRLWLGGSAPEIQLSRLADNGPGRLNGRSDKTVKYERRPMQEDHFIAAHDAYQLVSREGDREGAAFRFQIRSQSARHEG